MDSQDVPPRARTARPPGEEGRSPGGRGAERLVQIRGRRGVSCKADDAS
jgi:hypothetical protein